MKVGPKKAAYFCLVAPFLASFAQTIIGGAVDNSAISRNIFLAISLLILVSGFGFGIYALFSYKKTKGILLPATIGIVFHLLVVGIAISSFNSYQSEYQYFSVTSQMNSADLSYKQIILGRIHPKAPKEELFNTLTSGILASCPSCEILSTETIPSVPEHFKGIFNNESLNVSYVSIDTGDRTSGDMKFIFPDFDPQLTCQQLEDFVNQKRQLVGQNGTVSCIDSTN